MKIVFTSLSSLGDTASGAAISMATILRLLAARGWETASVTGSGFDRATKPSPESELQARGFLLQEDGFWASCGAAPHHFSWPLGTTVLTQVTASAKKECLRAVKRKVADLAPDILITYGAGDFGSEIRRWASERGIPVVFYLTHPGYMSAEAFGHIDRFITDSQATRDLYADRLGLDLELVGSFVDPKLPADFHPPQEPPPGSMITFVNPVGAKGVTIFYRIAEMMSELVVSARFLVVESRSTLEEAEERHGLPFSRLPNLRRLGLQDDMSDVYRRTRVMLVPSVWHESGGRVSLEAMARGIPVVCSAHGGLAENVGEGGHLVAVPERLRADPSFVPAPSAALPWVSVLRDLWTDRDTWKQSAEKARRHWLDHHDP